jgi:mono/diheme cytochrome c family protein
MFRVFFIAIICAVPALACAQDPAAVGRGEKVFAAQKCGICHALAGTGNTKGPLDDVGSRLSPADIRQWVTNAPVMASKINAQRKPAMKTFTNILGSDLDDLVTYLQTLKKK